MWKSISDEMKNSGYDVTIQVENKWKTLERQCTRRLFLIIIRQEEDGSLVVTKRTYN